MKFCRTPICTHQKHQYLPKYANTESCKCNISLNRRGKSNFWSYYQIDKSWLIRNEWRRYYHYFIDILTQIVYFHHFDWTPPKCDHIRFRQVYLIWILINFSWLFNGFADFVSSCIKSQILMSTEDIKEDTEEPSGNQGAIMKPEEEVEYQKEDAPRMEIPQCDKIKIALQTRERFMSSKRYQRSGFNHLFWSERRMHKIYKQIASLRRSNLCCTKFPCKIS